MVKNRGLCFFKAKKREKSEHQLELCRKSENQENLKRSLKGLEFFSVLVFFKTDLKKNVWRVKKNVEPFRPPPLGLRGLKI